MADDTKNPAEPPVGEEEDQQMVLANGAPSTPVIGRPTDAQLQVGRLWCESHLNLMGGNPRHGAPVGSSATPPWSAGNNPGEELLNAMPYVRSHQDALAREATRQAGEAARQEAIAAAVAQENQSLHDRVRDQASHYQAEAARAETRYQGVSRLADQHRAQADQYQAQANVLVQEKRILEGQRDNATNLSLRQGRDIDRLTVENTAMRNAVGHATAQLAGLQKRADSATARANATMGRLSDGGRANSTGGTGTGGGAGGGRANSTGGAGANKRKRMQAEKKNRGAAMMAQSSAKPRAKPGATKPRKQDCCALCSASTAENPEKCARCDAKWCRANICPKCATELNIVPGVDDWYCEGHEGKPAASITPPPPGGAEGNRNPSRRRRRRGGEQK